VSVEHAYVLFFDWLLVVENCEIFLGGMKTEFLTDSVENDPNFENYRFWPLGRVSSERSHKKRSKMTQRIVGTKSKSPETQLAKHESKCTILGLSIG
jgi:hypothetical protein